MKWDIGQEVVHRIVEKVAKAVGMKRTAIRSLLAAGGWLVLAFVPASPRAISSVPAAAPTACAWTRRRRTSNKMMVSQHNDAFDVCVDLGEGS